VKKLPAAEAADEPVYPEPSQEALLEAMRKKAAFDAMMQLLEQGAADEAALMQVAAPMSEEELHQVRRLLLSNCLGAGL
jgi:hypothetical protein